RGVRSEANPEYLKSRTCASLQRVWIESSDIRCWIIHEYSSGGTPIKHITRAVASPGPVPFIDYNGKARNQQRGSRAHGGHFAHTRTLGESRYRRILHRPRVVSHLKGGLNSSITVDLILPCNDSSNDVAGIHVDFGRIIPCIIKTVRTTAEAG